jgi:hypothetical protein
LLSDSKGELIKAIGIAYEGPENYKSVINVHSNGISANFLPEYLLFCSKRGKWDFVRIYFARFQTAHFSRIVDFSIKKFRINKDEKVSSISIGFDFRNFICSK